MMRILLMFLLIIINMYSNDDIKDEEMSTKKLWQYKPLNITKTNDNYTVSFSQKSEILDNEGVLSIYNTRTKIKHRIEFTNGNYPIRSANIEFVTSKNMLNVILDIFTSEAGPTYHQNYLWIVSLKDNVIQSFCKNLINISNDNKKYLVNADYEICFGGRLGVMKDGYFLIPMQINYMNNNFRYYTRLNNNEYQELSNRYFNMLNKSPNNWNKRISVKVDNNKVNEWVSNYSNEFFNVYK